MHTFFLHNMNKILSGILGIEQRFDATQLACAGRGDHRGVQRTLRVRPGDAGCRGGVGRVLNTGVEGAGQTKEAIDRVDQGMHH